MYEIAASVGVPGAPGAEAVDRAAVGERAARREVGDHDDALGVQDLRRLGHEMHAGEQDDVRGRLLRLLGELR